MKKPKIVLTHPLHAPTLKSTLRPHARVKICTSQRELKKELQTADALITLLTDPVGKALLEHGPQLKVVGNFAVGVDNIDLSACAQRKIKVVHTPKVLTRATAETTLTLLMACAKRVTEGHTLCRQGRFQGWKPDLLLGQLLQGRHAVLLGQGRIGKEVSRLFRAVGMTTEFITRQHSAQEISKRLQRAQVFSIHCPLTPKTHHWLNASRLKKLPADAIVLNTARGPIIDETALIQTLKSKKIFAAGLDVYEDEPAIPKSLCNLPNVVLLPHLGSAAAETRQQMAETVMTGVLRVLSGQRPWNLVNLKGHGPS